MAVTITTPSTVLMMRGFEPRAQNLGSWILREECLSGLMRPDPPSFRNRTVAPSYKRAIQADSGYQSRISRARNLGYFAGLFIGEGHRAAVVPTKSSLEV